MNDKRSTLVTIICVIGFIAALCKLLSPLLIRISWMPSLFSFQVAPVWFLMFSVILAIVYLIAWVFIWKMKKWALVFYTLLLLVEFILYGTIGRILIMVSKGSIAYLIISVIFLGLLWTQFKKMS